MGADVKELLMKIGVVIGFLLWGIATGKLIDLDSPNILVVIVSAIVLAVLIEIQDSITEARVRREYDIHSD
jgi:hypothetical protein